MTSIDVSSSRSLPRVDMGEGPTLLALHGYGMQARAYLPLAQELHHRLRVVIPDLFALSQWRELWTFQHLRDCLMYTLDDLGIERVTVIGHSFGGGLALGLASRRADRIDECVFVDTLGPKRQLSLAREAARPIGLLHTASRPAAMSFLWMWMTHPVQLASAAVDGYFSKRDTDIDELRRTGLSCHVLWAADDEILSRQDGEDFARRLNASFTLAEQPPGDEPLTHDWIIDRPELFVTYLDKLGLRILRHAHDLGDSTTPQSRHT